MNKMIKGFSACMLCALLCVSTVTPAFAKETEPIADGIKIYAEQSAENERMTEIGRYDDNKMALFENGRTDFQILVPETDDFAFNEAVSVLKDILKQMSGKDLPVVHKAVNGQKYIEIAVADRIKNGFELKIQADRISITAGSLQSAQDGIYTFIEDKLGCAFLTPDYTYIPEQKTIYLEKCSDAIAPALAWRDVYSYETMQNNWAAKLRLNGIDVSSDKPDKNIEEWQYEGWGTWCHNCYDYLSPDEYFESHPEYFSEVEIDGEKQRVHFYADRDAYLCLSNPEVFDIVKESLAKMIEENPEKLYWDFSGNDNPALAGCQCDKCRAADEAAGGTGMGTLLPFLNKLADAFPDKIISSLAYLHTVEAPKGIEARSNVAIKLCSMPGDQASSYLNAKTDNARAFAEQVDEWSKICNNIIIWDYVVDFSHLLMPFPNFGCQLKNQKFYEEHNVTGVFHQASREKGGEMTYLRSYILAKLMWQGSEMDIEKEISRYLCLYYGAAAPKMAEFMNKTADEMLKSSRPLGLYDGLMPHYNGYLSPENIERYKQIVNDALKTVADEEVLTQRVKSSELSLLYTEMLLPKLDDEERQPIIDSFKALANEQGITMTSETQSLDDFLNDGLSELVKNEQKELHKTRNTVIIAVVAVVAGFALIGTVAAVIIPKIRSRRIHR